MVGGVPPAAEAASRSWSEPVNTSLCHEHFLGVPGCGDVTLHLERSANTTHVWVEPLSKVEVSAKEIRARIQQSQDAPLITVGHPSFFSILMGATSTSSSFQGFLCNFPASPN